MSLSVMGYAESCTSAGQVQYKYTASGCSYTTQTRTCCPDKTWSDWDGDCVSCTSSQCKSGSTCINKVVGPVAGEPPADVVGASQCGWLHVYDNCVPGEGWQTDNVSMAYCTCSKSGYTYRSDRKSCMKCEWINASYNAGECLPDKNHEDLECNRNTFPSKEWTSSTDPGYDKWNAHGDWQNYESCKIVECPVSGRYSSYVTRKIYRCHT